MDIAFSSCLLSAYEGLKHSESVVASIDESGLLSAYEGLKPRYDFIVTCSSICLLSAYEGLKLISHSPQSHSVSFPVY